MRAMSNVLLFSHVHEGQKGGRKKREARDRQKTWEQTQFVDSGRSDDRPASTFSDPRRSPIGATLPNPSVPGAVEVPDVPIGVSDQAATGGARTRRCTCIDIAFTLIAYVIRFNN